MFDHAPSQDLGMASQDGEQLDAAAIAGPSPMTSSHASVKFRFSSDQRQILQDYWSKRMTVGSTPLW